MFSRITSSRASLRAGFSHGAASSSSVDECLLPLLSDRSDNLLADARKLVRQDNFNKLHDLLREQPRLLTTPLGNKETLLTEAAGAGKHKAVQAILAQAVIGPDIEFEEVVNHRNADGRSALIRAIQHGHEDVAKALLKHDAVAISDPSIADAINRGRLDVAQSLVRHGPQNARLASTDQSLVDARSAALWGDATKLQALLGQNPELLTMQFGNNQDTLLTTAAGAGEGGSLQAVLTHALLNRCAEFGAILNHRNAEQETALMLAIRAGAIDVAAALMKHDSIEVNRPNRSGQTPLHLAAAQADPRFAAGLLNLASIDPNPRDGEGNTPLHVAVEQGRSEIAILLVSHSKTAPDEVNHAGQSPLALAIDAKNLPVFDALMRRQGVDPDRQNESRQTLLWQQVLDWNNNLSLGGSEPALQPWSYILGRLAASPGVNSNHRGWEGETPLTYLCKLSCPWHIGAHAEFNAWRNNAVKAMLEGSRLGAGGLDPGADNAEGKTPYQLALATGNTGLLAVLDADAYARSQRH